MTSGPRPARATPVAIAQEHPGAWRVPDAICPGADPFRPWRRALVRRRDPLPWSRNYKAARSNATPARNGAGRPVPRSAPAHPSLPLDRGGRLSGDVVDDARDALHLVHDPARADVEEVVGQPRPVRGHEVDGLDGAQADDVVVAAAITHHANRTHRQEHRERLRRLVVEIVAAQFFDEYVIRLAQQVRVILAHFAEDAHAEARTRERM